MKINEILKKCKTDYKFFNEKNVTVKGLSENSREIKENFIFFAKKGKNFNGEKFVNNILNIKNIIIVLNNDSDFKKICGNNINKIPIIKTKNFNKLIGEISSIFYKSEFFEKIAITGTNGKTSICDYTRQIWENLNFKCSSVGTLGVLFKKKKSSLQLTTPQADLIHKTLSKLNSKKCSHIILEASSIGLDQDRLFPMKFDKVAFTNLSRDHLDYHGNMKKYLQSKLKLFREYTNKNSIAVINSDNLYSKHFINFCKKEKIETLDFGKKATFLKISKIQDNKNVEKTEFFLKNKKILFKFNCTSTFEIYNLVCALILVFGKKLNKKHFNHTKIITNPSGRLEKIFDKNSVKIFIDYAHTPEAIKNVLKALTKIKKKKLISIIGCGGNRDKGKRPLITKQALKYSDLVILADDNPRFENPDKIRSDMLNGITDLKRIKNIGNRKKAIEFSVSLLKKDDILLISGKGHENFQIIRGEKKYFCDKKVTLKILEKNGTLDIK